MLSKTVRFKTCENTGNSNDSKCTSIILPEKLKLAKKELQIQNYWHANNIYFSRLKEQTFSKRFTIYEAPAFAVGPPTLQNIFSQIVKDVIARYHQQNGFYVEQFFTLNSHGLAIEWNVAKKDDFNAKIDPEEFARKCQSFTGHSEWMWRKYLQKIGRWWDMDSDLSTSNRRSIETVWFIFKILMQKGLIYKSSKIMPFSIGCHTSMSTFEAQMNLKEISRPKIILKFKLDSTNYLLICTTSPWTLTGNVGVCVNPNSKYVRVKCTLTQEKFILAANRVRFYFNSTQYEILNEFEGKALLHWKYAPIFNYFQLHRDNFQIVVDSFVSENYGTGVVHLTPFLCERDYKICMENQLISPKMPAIILTDDDGKFLPEIKDFAGKNVMECDDLIIETLEAKSIVFQRSQTKRLYPHCWVSDTPLISKFSTCWFLRLDGIKEDLKKNLESINWGTKIAKERMAYWIDKLNEWNLSRAKFWGIPIPIWSSSDGRETACVGSFNELQELSGIHPDELSIDKILIPSVVTNSEPLKRVSEVFDCWFESGCLPFEGFKSQKTLNKNNSNKSDCGEYIIENQDEINKWLLGVFLIGTALGATMPFKTVLFTGNVLTNNNNNHKQFGADFLHLVRKYGADSIRIYFVNAAGIQNDIQLCEKEIQNTFKQIKSWYGSIKFLIENISNYQTDTGQDFVFKQLPKCWNLMDVWMVSVTNSLMKFVNKEMRSLHLKGLIVEIFKLIDYVKIYIRLNANRLKKRDDPSLEVLFYVQWYIVKIMSPFAPFTTEYFYQLLKIYVVYNKINRKKDSVHLCRLPSPNFCHINYRLERAFLNLQTAVQLVEKIRQKSNISGAFRLTEAIILTKKTEVLDDIKRLIAYLSETINVENVVTSTNFLRYHVYLKNDQAKYNKKGLIIIGGERVNIEEIHFGYNATEFKDRRWAIEAKNEIVLILDLNITNWIAGVGNEVISIILRLQKKYKLNLEQKFAIYVGGSDNILSAVEKCKEFIERKVKMPIVMQNTVEPHIIAQALVVKTEKIRNDTVHISIIESKPNQLNLINNLAL